MGKILLLVFSLCVPCLDSIFAQNFDSFLLNLIGRQFKFGRDEYPLPGGLSEPYEEYDFVIIGAGSAGSVIANRLSENENWNVLLLEAGYGESFFNSVPLFTSLFYRSDYTWHYSMTPPDNFCLGGQMPCDPLSGKAVGGTSVINNLVYTRGSKRDWDDFAKAGNTGWSYDDVLPYFLKFEKNTRTVEEPDKAYVSIEYLKYRSPLTDKFLKAWDEAGYPTRDYDEHTIGFNYLKTNQLLGRRHSAAKAFLYPYRERKNLHVLTESRATKINIDKDSKVADSVRYERNGKTYVVKAKKEIIVSAGAIFSPQLLMLSGVGPKEHLNEIGIDVIKDLKVGQNFKNHICMDMTFTMDGQSINNIQLGLELFVEGVRYFSNWTGVLTLTFPEILGFVNTNITNSDPDYRDGEIIFSSYPMHLFAERLIPAKKGFFKKTYADISNHLSFSALLTATNPESKGEVRLDNKNPHTSPRIIPNYLSDERDVKTFIALVRLVQTLVETDTFKKIGAKVHFLPYPTCEGIEVDSNEYWECALRSMPIDYYHFSSTCRMGPADDPEAVVDPELKVYGISNLRVADTSILPKAISGHTHGPAMMIGEKVSDMIKVKWMDQN